MKFDPQICLTAPLRHFSPVIFFSISRGMSSLYLNLMRLFQNKQSPLTLQEKIAIVQILVHIFLLLPLSPSTHLNQIKFLLCEQS